jgi:hypothetical protein
MAELVPAIHAFLFVAKQGVDARHAPGMTNSNDSNPFKQALEHDPEKWEPVFGKDHAQTKS